jgi:hypothetical protein
MRLHMMGDPSNNMTTNNRQAASTDDRGAAVAGHLIVVEALLLIRSFSLGPIARSSGGDPIDVDSASVPRKCVAERHQITETWDTKGGKQAFGRIREDWSQSLLVDLCTDSFPLPDSSPVRNYWPAGGNVSLTGYVLKPNKGSLWTPEMPGPNSTTGQNKTWQHGTDAMPCPAW